MDIDFDKLKKIDGVNIVNFNPIRGSVHEPEDGNIYYNNRLYYFKLHHEFDFGNNYVVYDNNVPVYYFTLHVDVNNEEEDSPWVSKEEWDKYDL